MKLKNLLERRNPEKFKDRESDNASSSEQKSRGRIFSSLALMLKVYANDGNHQENEKIVIVDSVNKAFETLKIIFTRRVETLPKNDACQQLDTESSKESALTKDQSRRWYPSCISRYLQDCRRANQQSSLCRSMTRIEQPRVFVACRRRESRVEYSQQDLVDIANVLIKLKKYLKQHCQRQQRSIAANKAIASVDKAVQCDYLRVSPELRFFSRSSVLANEPRGNSSLEHVANYRPEFRAGRGNKNLRSLSSSAIFGMPRERYNYSRSPRRGRLRRGATPSLEAIRRDDDDTLRVEADLTSFHRNPRFTDVDCRNDVLAVRKILLDEYITEVKEIIRSELSDCAEDEILGSVRKRMMDEEVAARSDSCHSLSPTASYVTARECLSSCCFRENHCDCKDSGMCLKFCESTCSKGRVPTSHLGNKARYSETSHEDKSASSTSAKSSQSVDSGVQLDYPRSSIADWTSSDDASSRDFKSKVTSPGYSDGSSSSSDEMLCRRVESAVRKFTEKLIVCERRARDRSRSRTGKQPRRDNPRGCASEQRASCNSTRELANCSSEDERITGISTPSLVSLSDEEIRT